jgi:hypothetical protein
MVCIVKIELPEEHDPKEFVTFMNEEYFPAIYKGLTRTGQVTRLLLFQSETRGTVRQFYLHVSDVMVHPKVDDENIRRKFDSFGAEIDDLGRFFEAAEWQKSD